MMRLILVLSLFASGAHGGVDQAPRYVGDVNGDGMIDAVDAFAVFGHIRGAFPLEGPALAAADVNQDRLVTQEDFERLIQVLRRPVTEPPFEAVPAGLPVVREARPSRALPGAPVILLGRGFDTSPGKNTVSFGGVRAVVTQAAAERLDVIVPAGALSSAVTVEVLGLRSLGVPFLVGAPPVPRPLEPPLPGEVHLAMPAPTSVSSQAVVWAPLLFHTGSANFGVLSTLFRFNPANLTVINLVPGYAPLSLAVWGKDGIDNAVGSLSILLYSTLAAQKSPPRGLVSAGAVLFTSQPSFPGWGNHGITGTVGRFRDETFPGNPLGGLEPFFVTQGSPPTSPPPEPSQELPRVREVYPDAAPIGAEVRILGQNLGTPGLPVFVIFGSQPTMAQVVSDQEVRVTVPSRATSGALTVVRSFFTAANSVSFGVLPDAVPPRIVRTTPAGGALPSTGSITIEFSEVIDPSTVGPDALYLEGVEFYGLYRETPEASMVKVPCTLILTQVGQSTAVLKPAFPLPGGPWRLVVTDKVRDLAGNAIANPLWTEFVVP